MCDLHITSCDKSFTMTSSTGNCIWESSSWVFGFPSFFTPCLWISFYSSKLSIVLFCIRHLFVLILCTFSIPQSAQSPWRQLHGMKEGMRLARPTPHTISGWGTLLQQILSTNSSTWPESRLNHEVDESCSCILLLVIIYCVTSLMGDEYPNWASLSDH